MTDYILDEERIGGWMIAHSRMGDTVFFGVFTTLDEAKEFLASHEFSGNILPLVSPKSDSRLFWQDLYYPVSVINS